MDAPTSGIKGGDFSTCRPVDDPNYTAGQIWETCRKDWVWETGIDYAVQPNQPSGVIINGQFYGTGDATYGHKFNYPDGQIIFNDAVPTTSEVHVEYAYRFVQVYLNDDCPSWFKELQFYSFEPGNVHFEQTASGDYSLFGKYRVQLPAIVIQFTTGPTSKPYQLGDGSLHVYRDVMFNIVSGTAKMRDKLIDILTFKQDSSLILYNTNLIDASGLSPYDEDGMPYPDRVMYPYLVENLSDNKKRHFWYEKARPTLVEQIHPNLYEARVRITMHTIADYIG